MYVLYVLQQYAATINGDALFSGRYELKFLNNHSVISKTFCRLLPVLKITENFGNVFDGGNNSCQEGQYTEYIYRDEFDGKPSTMNVCTIRVFLAMRESLIISHGVSGFMLTGNADIIRFINSRRMASLGDMTPMDGGRMPRRILEWKPMGRRIRGRPRKRWIEEVEEDIQTMGIREWRKLSKERTEWNKIAEKAKTHSGL